MSKPPMSGSRILVTGGAGFIGRHLVAALLSQGATVTVVDDLSGATTQGAAALRETKGVSFLQGDVGVPAVAREALADADAVFHLAANPEVRVGETDPASHVDRNVHVTFALLEAMRRSDARRIVFTSTSTVYGNATLLPTPEDYGPLAPISVYGASKLAAEALISSYCGTFDLAAQVFRFANVVGPGATHGVVLDFVRKLRTDPRRLEVLGDGKQSKSYVHVADTVAGMLAPQREAPATPGECRFYNIGTDDVIDVDAIADVVCGVLGLTPQRYYVTGAPGGGGWRGDVPRMWLDCSKLRGLGWEPKMGSEAAVRAAAEWVAGNAP